jgi:dihydropyrimidinase
METVLIRNGTIVTAAERYEADVYVDRGVISSIGPQSGRPADTVLDASGLLVLPGGIDAHTHLDMPLCDIASTDDFETGTIAAACGGTTTIIDFATQEAGQGLLPALDAWMARAEGKAVIDYAFHVAICEWNDRTASDMARLVQRDGVTSFKLFMAYPGRLMLDDASIFRVLLHARHIGALVSVHAENGGVIEVLVSEALRRGDVAPRFHALTRPAAAEREAVARAIALAEMASAPIYIVHVSCTGAVECIEQARERGLPVHGETCPHYLVLSDAEYERPGFEAAKYVMSPPLRSVADQDALWRATASRAIEVVATDHCPFGMDDPPHKRRGLDDFSKIPSGAPGIETRLMLLWDSGVRAGRISPNRFVDLTATAPAKIFGLWPRKGTIAVGTDADLVLWDPGAQTRLSASTHHMRVDYSLYEGRVVTGAPAAVLSRGEVVVRNGAYVGRRGRGQFLKRAPHAGRAARIDS